MVKTVTKKDFYWGYAATALNIGVGLILLPVILIYLNPVDVSLWLVFVTLASIAQLLELGFQPTLSRNSAYIHAGAQSLSKVGIPEGTNTSSIINKKLLDSLVEAARRIYQYVAIIAAIVLITLGTFYVSSLLDENQNKKYYFTAWIIFSCGYIINFYYGYINALLQGRGDITQANKVIVLTRSILIIIGAWAVTKGYGLMGLAVASLLSSLIGRIIALRLFHGKNKSIDIVNKEEVKKSREVMIKILLPNALRLGAVHLGAFLVLRGNILIASSILGLEAAASYSISLTILMTLSSISMVICQLQIPYMSALQAKGEKEKLVSTLGEILIVSWTIYILGLALFIILGDDLLLLIGSNTKLLDRNLLLLLGAVLLFELNHSIAATYLTSINRIPFVSAAIISGLCIQILALITINKWGIIALILSQGVVQLFYNNWKWPLEALNDLKTRLSSVLKFGFILIMNKINKKVKN